MAKCQWIIVLCCLVVMLQGSVILAETIHPGGSIASNQTWAQADGPHIVTGNINIQGNGSVTIEPGCVVQLEDYIKITIYGTLNATGTMAEEILFTRNDPDDQWYGLSYQADSSGSLAYCTMEYSSAYNQGYAVYGSGYLPQIEHCTFRNNSYGVGGTGLVSPTLAVSNSFSNNTHAGIDFTNCSGVSISNQAFDGQVGTYGAVYLKTCGSFHFGSGNTATGNSWALTIDLASYPDMASTGNIPIAGNTNDDGIQVRGSLYSGTMIWHDLNVDYILTESSIIQTGASLNIDPGCVVKLENYVNLTVYGTFEALGTPAEEILFTSRDSDDNWYGLHFQSGSAGSLAYCTMEGATAYNQGYAIYGNGYLPQIEHCTFRNNSYGVGGTGLVNPTLAVSNSFSDNTEAGIYFINCSGVSISNQSLDDHTGTNGAVYLNICGSFHFGSGNTATGNSWALTMDLASYPDLASAGNIPIAGNSNDDGIQVRGSLSSGIMIWHDLGLDYILTTSSNIQTGAALTIDPGCVVKFENYVNLTVYGTFEALGTPAQEILFTNRDSDDHWYGVNFQSGSVGSLAYCTMEGATAYNQSYAIYGNNYLPQIEHCTFRNNSYGVGGTGLVNPTLSVANTFSDNTEAGIHFTNCSGVTISNQTLSGHTGTYGAVYLITCGSFHFGSGNAVTGNSWALTMDLASYPDLASAGNIPMAGNINDDGIQVSGSLYSGNMVWHDLGLDYILTSNPSIQSGSSLSIDPGCVVKFENYRTLSVYGALTVLGTPAEEVFFTRRDPDDSWYGVSFNSGSSGSWSYCTIEHSTAYDAGSGVNLSNADILFTHCTFRNNSTGLTVANSSPTLINCDVVDNDLYGMNLSGNSVPLFGTSLAQWNNIHSNGLGNHNRDLRNGTANVFARYVYWGTTDELEVEGKVYHRLDDAALGQVYFSPWANAAHDETYEDGSSPVHDQDPTGIPIAFAFAQNFPNPFNPVTTISYDLPRECRVLLKVYDVSGRLVETLVDRVESGGFKSVAWRPEGRSSGVYFCSIEAGDFQQVRKMSLVQ